MPDLGKALSQQAALKRVKALQQSLQEDGLDAQFIYDRTNTLYLTGFPCSNSILLITPREAVFLTDFRYLERARAEITALEVRPMSQQGTDEQLGKLLKSLGVKTLGFEGTMPYAYHANLKKAVGRTRLVESSESLTNLRAVKDADELGEIARNQKLNEKLFRAVLAGVTAGETEAAIARKIKMTLTAAGYEEAFASIIAAGPNSALPHASPGGQRVRKGEYLLFDTGVRARFYHSDMTRTVGVGKTSPRHREIYEIVLEAQKAALATIRDGALCKAVDAAARDVITNAGYGEYFGHGTGHGVGLQIHEAPTLNARSTQILRENMVVTVEPGIYLPGFGGVRIEDLVVVTADGYRNLTSVSKKWQEIL